MAAQTVPYEYAPAHATLRPVLLIGPEAAPLAQAAQRVGPFQCTLVHSFVEAILAGAPDLLPQPYSLIVAGISRDQADLHAAIGAFRKVHSTGRLVLLCDACQEPLCRRALAAGADDYLILPSPPERIWTLAANGTLASAAPATASHGNARMPPEPQPLQPPAQDVPSRLSEIQPPDPAASLQLLQLPVVVQTALMNAVLQSATDLPARALAILQSYFQWPGTLRMAPKMPDPQPQETSLCIPMSQGESDFGVLLLEYTRPSDPLLNQLSQAAQWLAGWMVLAQRTRQLRELAITDELSGAYNRRYFIHFVSQLLDKARAGQFRVTLLYFDIDDFKHYNDVYGHLAGDSIIREMIRLLRLCTRPHDLVARIGGDEFAVVFWDNEPPRQANSQHPRSALAATDRFRKALASCDWQRVSNVTGRVSVSGGLATFPWDARSLDALMASADANLIKAKQQGKNVIILRQPVDDEPPREMTNAK